MIQEEEAEYESKKMVDRFVRNYYNPVLNTYRKAKWLNLPVCGNFSHFCFLRFVVRKLYPEIFLIFLFNSFGW